MKSTYNVLAIVVVLALGAVAVAAPLGTWISIPARGDLDENGVINSDDATYLEQYFAGAISLPYADVADMNGDMRVTLVDLAMLHQMALANPGGVVAQPINAPSGDLNRDYIVDVQDLKILGNFLRYQTAPDTFRLELADIDDDGQVGLADLYRMFKARK